MSDHSDSLRPRPCGTLALLRWCKAGAVLLKKLSWEWWAASTAAFIAMAFLADPYPALALAFVAWGAVIGRGLLGVGEVLMKSPTPDWAAQWEAWSRATLPILMVAALVLTSLCVLVPQGMFPEGLPEPAGRPVFVVWAVFAWCGWLVRSLGPMGFIGPLMDKGCPPLPAFKLQMEAFHKNQMGMLGLLMAWLAVLFLLLVLPWLAIPALLWWPLVIRCAFADIFEGGIRIAQPAPAPAPALAKSNARLARPVR